MRFLSYRRGVEAAAGRKTQMAMRGAGMTSISGLSTAPEFWIWLVLRALAPNLQSWLPRVEDYALAQEGKAARPYIWRLIIVIMLTLPSMAAELQGRASPAVTACWSRTTAYRSSRSACGTRVAEDSNRANRTAVLRALHSVDGGGFLIAAAAR